VTMRTNLAWETTATLHLLSGMRGTGAPTGRREAGAYHVTMRTACLLYICFSVNRRAALYVPGNDEGKVKKIPSLNVDCVILDCEDGVALNRKVCMLFSIMCNFCWQCCCKKCYML